MHRQSARSLPPVKKPDGRHARKARTSQAIVAALHALLEEGRVDPTAKMIADRASVAIRSIGQHFPSREHLLLALASFHAERLPKPTPPPPGTPFDRRVEQFVGNRAKALEATVTLRRAAHQVAGKSKAIGLVLTEIARRRREELRRFLGPELKSRPAWLNSAVETLCSGAAWDTLRTEQHLASAAAASVLARSLRQLLGG